MKRNSLSIAFILAGSIGASAQPGDLAAGEDAFVNNCVECHAAAKRIVRKIEGDTAEAKIAWLDSFLDDHYLNEMDVKLDLIAYLISL